MGARVRDRRRHLRPTPTVLAWLPPIWRLSSGCRSLFTRPARFGPRRARRSRQSRRAWFRGPGSLAWSAQLPAGLSLDPFTGAISGTPTATEATTTHTITITDLAGAATAAVAITITDGIIPVISELSETNRIFAVGPKATVVNARKHRRGTTFRYRLSERPPSRSRSSSPPPAARSARRRRKQTSRQPSQATLHPLPAHRQADSPQPGRRAGTSCPSAGASPTAR